MRLSEHAAEIAPTDPSVLDTLAVAYAAAGRRDEALARTIEDRSAGW